MNPLESLIGLSPVDTGAERVYVNRIPNVNPDLIKAIAESDEKSDQDPTGIGTVWKEVKGEAFDCLKTDLLAAFAKRANFREIVDQSELPDEINDSKSLTVSSDRMIGVVVTMPKSRYQQLFVRSLYISLTAPLPANLALRSYDGDKGKQIGDDLIIPVTEDTFELPVNRAIDCSKSGHRSIFIGALIPSGTTLQSIGWSHDCMYAFNDQMSFDPEGSPTISEMDEMDHCYVALDYQIQLSIEKVIALSADRLKRVYALMCAAGIIDRGLKSKKASKWTLVNRDAEKLNLDDIRAEINKELSGACRLIYGQLELEKLTLVTRPDDQQGYFIGGYV